VSLEERLRTTGLVLLWSVCHIRNNFAFGLFKSEDDQPPVAKVLSSPPITLPIRTAVLDGSRSSDDKGSISYLWTREDTSPAAGVSTVYEAHYIHGSVEHSSIL